MTKINRKLEYALMSLKFMSSKGQGQLTQVKEICESTGCPFDATAKTMQQMTSMGLLKSVQGAHGGYMIIKDLSKVSLLELYRGLLGSLELAKCIHSDSACELTHSCNIISPIHELNQKLINFYDSLPLIEILKPQKHTHAHVELTGSLSEQGEAL
ncbi:MAG: Rrf2 family transcriptional regulator [Bdellovibrionales bacterium]|nr:Rrf2 family transcriptional regulator [Bdellovibrionales bacterium]